MHASGKQQSGETQETRAAAQEENREAAHITRVKLYYWPHNAKYYWLMHEELTTNFQQFKPLTS